MVCELGGAVSILAFSKNNNNQKIQEIGGLEGWEVVIGSIAMVWGRGKSKTVDIPVGRFPFLNGHDARSRSARSGLG